MQDFLAISFIVFMLALYAGITLIFIFVGIRNWIWRPVTAKFRRGQPENRYSRIRPGSREESLS